jgi:alpha-L-rhamnosidase
MRRKVLLLAAVVGLVLPVIGQSGRDTLAAGFVNPPQEARLRCYWWWLNGNTNEAAITRDLEQMKVNGYGGALLVDANGSEQRNNRMVTAGPTFASDRWRELYRHALKEAARLDLEISLNIESGWNLGGPTVKPEQGAKLLTWSRSTVQGGAEVRRALPQPPAKIDYYRDIAVLAYPLRHGEALPARPIRELAVKSEGLDFERRMAGTRHRLSGSRGTGKLLARAHRSAAGGCQAVPRQDAALSGDG